MNLDETHWKWNKAKNQFEIVKSQFKFTRKESRGYKTENNV